MADKRDILFSIAAVGIAFYCATSVLKALKVLTFFLDVLFPFVLGALFALLLKKPCVTCEKLLSRWIKRKKLARFLSITVVILLLLIFIVLAILLLLPSLTASMSSLIEKLPEFAKLFEDAVKTVIEKIGISADFIEPLDEIIMEEIVRRAGDFIISTENVNSFVTVFVELFSTLFFASAFTTYLLYDREWAKEYLSELFRKLFKKRGDYAVAFLDCFVSSFDNYFFGQIIEAFILGGLCFLGMLILKIPYPLLVSALVTVTAVIPLLGAIIGTVPSFIIIMTTSPVKALIFLIFIVLLQALEGNLIYPKVVGNKIELHPVLVLLALLLGGGLFGVLGILLFIPLFSAIYNFRTNGCGNGIKKRLD